MITMHKSIGVIFLWACIAVGGEIGNAAMPVEQIAVDLRQRLQQVDPLAAPPRTADAILYSPVLVSRFYAQRHYRPAWVNAAGPLPMATALLEVVANAEGEGLRSADYHSRALSHTLTKLGTAHAPTNQQLAELDLLLTDAFLTYGAHLVSGRPAIRKTGGDWALEPRARDLVTILQEVLEGNSEVVEALDTLAPSPGYVRLRLALSYYRALDQIGGWPTVSPGPKLEKGAFGARVKELRARLRVTGDLQSAPGSKDPVIETADFLKVAHTGHPVGAGSLADGRTDIELLFDEGLWQAVRRFQQRHGLEADGIVGLRTLAALNVPVAERIRQIELNMERWRWLPDELGRRYILINIPDFKMTVVEDGQQVMEVPVVVGKSQRPTPVFAGTMSYLVLNPYWHVPPRIAVEDMLPQLRKDPYALYRQNIHIFNRANQQIDPGSINWQAVNPGNFPYQLRQEPGPSNALGKVKFIFPNAYHVYLHDTSSPQLFNRTQRAYSSGCIRVAQPIELAEYLLSSDPRWSRDAILSTVGGKRERTVPLPEKVPVYLLYWTAWADESGIVHFREDIYQHDKQWLQVL